MDLCSGFTSENDLPWKLEKSVYMSGLTKKWYLLLVGNVFSIWSVSNEHRVLRILGFRSVDVGPYDCATSFEWNRYILLVDVIETLLVYRADIAEIVLHGHDSRVPSVGGEVSCGESDFLKLAMCLKI